MRAMRSKLEKIIAADTMPHGAYVCADGGHLCAECVRVNLTRIVRVDIHCPDDKQWTVVGVDQPDGQQCANCSKTIS